MAVHKLKDGRWIVKFEKGTLPDDPNRTREYFGRGIEAEKNAHQRNDELKLRPYVLRTPKERSPLFSELANAYLAAMVGSIEDSTLENMMWKLNGIINPEIGNTPAMRLTKHRLDQYVQKRLRDTITIRTGKKDNPSFKILTDKDGLPRHPKRTTIHREITDIQTILNWAVEREFITRNPVLGYKKPKRDDEIIPPATRDEVFRMLGHAPQHLIRALCISYFTGLRPGRVELMPLTWEDINFEIDTILVRSAKKGGPRMRLVPLHKRFKKMLKQWRVDDGDPPGDRPVIHYKGRQVGSIKKAFNTAKKNAGITRRLRPYDLRHAFASALLHGNADLKSTSEIIGHSRTDTTTRIYQHTNIEMHRAAINKLPDLELPK